TVDGSLFTVGTKYALVVSASLHVFYGSIYYGKQAYVQGSYNDETTYLKGTWYGWAASATTNPASMTWTSRDLELQFVMSIYEKSEIAIGKTDTAGLVNKLIQPFTARSKDIVGFNVTK